MADSTIAITAGTGTAVDTRTEATNGHHRQVVVLGDPATNAGVAPVDATAGLKVDLGADNDITGTVTANAGTNLNTSALALEAGNLASIKAKTDNIPALGQALAAASVPVVMTASQLSTLTPPAAITGFATSAKQDTLDTSVNTLLKPASTLAAVTSITNVVHVDDNAGSLTVDNAALTSLAGAINASKVDVNIASGSASGTEYTNAGTPPANPIGPTLLWNEGGTWRTVSTAKPLPVTASISTAGLATTATDTATASIDAKIPALGQALAAASVPVVLPAAQITTLTPPAAITGFATETTLGLVNAKLVSGTDIGDVTINNASGASAVNIQDGGNTITVDGTVAVTNSDITSIKTAVEIIDNAISGSEMQVDVVAALPAGTNAIGKLAANSGVDIGDVDVTSVPRSLSGPGQPGTAIDSYTQAAISAVTGTDQSLIAAPGANKQIWVYGIGFTCSVAGTVAIQDEDNTAITGVVSYAQYSGPLVHPSGNFSMPLWKVATNKALEADVTTATINGWINYAIISV